MVTKHIYWPSRVKLREEGCYEDEDGIWGVDGPGDLAFFHPTIHTEGQLLPDGYKTWAPLALVDVAAFKTGWVPSVGEVVWISVVRENPGNRTCAGSLAVPRACRRVRVHRIPSVRGRSLGD